jgi:hypothetical protein
MRKDDLLPKQIRLMTNDGLRFVASYRGMIGFATRQKNLGGPHAEKWHLAAARVTAAIDADDETGIQDAVATFSQAARQEGWAY